MRFSPHGRKRHSTCVRESTVTIDRRYRGPLTSANGGFASGLLGRALGAPAEVTLRLPPPLERPLRIHLGDGRAELLDGDILVAEARAQDPGLVPPLAPSFAEASVAARGAPTWGEAEFAECFVCGRRADGTGLELRPGPVGGRDVIVAAPWIARDVTAEIVWAAIDCPGAYAVSDPTRGEAVLGRMTARVDRLPRDGERCVVVGWPLGEDGRKLHAGTALYGEDGTPLAVARQVWILPRTP